MEKVSKFCTAPILLSATILWLASPTLRAESNLQNPFGSAPIYAPMPSASPSPSNSPGANSPDANSPNPPNMGGLVGGAVQNAQAKQGPVPQFDDQKTDQNDRKQGLGDASQSSQAAAAAAAAAGASMISAGVPMTMSEIPEVVAAGVTLIGMGTTELAQAAAMGASAGQSGQGANTLKQGGPNGSQLGMNESASAASGDPKLSPDATKALADKGIDPQDFLDKLKSGEDPASALGVNPDDTSGAPDDKTKALVDQALTQLGVGGPGGGGKQTLSLADASKNSDPNQPMGSANSPGNGPGNGTANATSNYSSYMPAEGPAASTGNPATNFAASLNNANPGSTNSPGGRAGATHNPNDPNGAGDLGPGGPVGIDAVLAKLGVARPNPQTGNNSEYAQANYQAARAMLQNQLMQKGIGMPFRGESIFLKASRVYRSYMRWKKEPKLAKNTT